MKIQLDHKSDAELLGLMLAGNGAAFAQIYQRWQATVYRFALRLSGSVELAEDVTQDVFLTLIHDGQQYSGRGSFVAYLLAMARHKVYRRLQRERRFVAIEDDDDDTSTPLDASLISTADPLADFSHNETAEAVRQAVLALPLHYREVVLLCHLHELSYAEAAEIMGCEIGTVCSRLYRARAILAKRLEALKSGAAPQINLNLARCSI